MRRRDFMGSGLLALGAVTSAANGANAQAPTGEDSPHDQVFDLRPVVDGIYAAVPRYKSVNQVGCNAAIVMLDDAVLVVDTHSTPVAAHSLIEQLKAVTDKPVKYVINTHFHADHYQGNQSYAAKWRGGLEIISSEATRNTLERLGAQRLRNKLWTSSKSIETLRADMLKATEPKERTQIQEALRKEEASYSELKSVDVTLPTLTFDNMLTLHRHTRRIQILWLGRAHTDGDVVVYLPDDKVIATGDVLNSCWPGMWDSYPYEWIETLERIEKLDFDHVISGHGELVRGKSQIGLWKEYLRELMGKTADAYAQGATLEEIKQTLGPVLVAKYADKFPGGPPHDGVCPPCPWPFRAAIDGNLQKAYSVFAGTQPLG
jgi:glyoxylase-like metal-dependent hydrolase (beta-lactamase superfamily II)